MKPISEPPQTRQDTLREKLLLTLDMFESGLALMREKLRRENPDLPEEAIEEKLIAWLSDRPLDGPVN